MGFPFEPRSILHCMVRTLHIWWGLERALACLLAFVQCVRAILSKIHA